MSQATTISWTDATWSPLRARVKADAAQIARAKGYTSLVRIAEKMAGHVGPHCEHVSPGCENCYSATNNGRCLPANGTGLPFDRRSRDLVEPFVDEKILLHPLKWKQPKRIFVENQSDLFGEWVTDEQIDRVFAVMALCPKHTFQLLTKRPERMAKYMGSRSHSIAYWETSARETCPFPLPNVWIGVSVENFATWDSRVHILKSTPAAKRFISYEPALESLGCVDFEGIDWVIVGGESGPGARPFDIQWARDTIAQCRDAGVACFVKQLGAKPMYRAHGNNKPDALFNGLQQLYSNGFPLKDRKGGDITEWPEYLRVREFPS